MTTTPVALSFQDLRKTYPNGTEALRGLSLDVHEGECFGLLGLNGAGKTTSINVIAGLVRPSGGRVLVSGFDAVRRYRQAHRRVGIAAQEIVLDERFLNVRQILSYNAGYFGMRKREAARRADALLAEFGLDDRRHAPVQELSGGMKRRLVLCKALMHDPPTLILDEPTAGADVPLRRQLWDKVQRLNRAGKTVLLTTHYLEEAEQLCQRVAILHRGRIVRQGPPDALVRESVPTWVAIQTDPPLAQVPPDVPPGLSPKLVSGDLYLQGTLHDPEVIRALTALARRGVGVRSLEQQTARLEDAFVELTKESM